MFRHMRRWGDDVAQMRVMDVVVLHHHNRRGGCGGVRASGGSETYSGGLAQPEGGSRLALTPHHYGHFGAIRQPPQSNSSRRALAQLSSPWSPNTGQ